MHIHLMEITFPIPDTALETAFLSLSNHCQFPSSSKAFANMAANGHYLRQLTDQESDFCNDNIQYTCLIAEHFTKQSNPDLTKLVHILTILLTVCHSGSLLLKIGNLLDM